MLKKIVPIICVMMDLCCPLLVDTKNVFAQKRLKLHGQICGQLPMLFDKDCIKG